MEYQKIINLLNSTPNQTTKFMTLNQMMMHVERLTLIVKLN